MKICIITEGYPAPNNPGFYEFLDQLVSAWADMGNTITVIYPIPYFVEYFNKNRYYKKIWKKRTKKRNKITIICPRFFRVSDRKLGVIDTQKISYYSFHKAAVRTLKRLKYKPDIIYSHFLSAGCHAGDIGNLMNIPAYCAFGESSLWSIDNWNRTNVKKSLSKLAGIISVSSENKRILIENKLFRKDDIKVFPNGVDHTIFLQKNKREIRKKLGYPQKAFIGAYVGSFSSCKGALRAQKAAVDAGNIPMIYIGGGSCKPEGSNILFCGKVPHVEIPEYLNAADFFILPTKSEGCCNAIIEAMACGLPIISSAGAYNDDILSESYSIRTDPDDIVEMTKAIKFLKDNPDTRAEMSRASKEASFKFDIVSRASAIIDFLQ